MNNATIIGVAIGDALGATFETCSQSDPKLLWWDGKYKDSKDHKWNHQLEIGQFTDDTQMTLVLANHLTFGKFDKYSLAYSYACWLTGENTLTGKSRGVGGTTKQALKDFLDKKDICPVVGALGTGPIMRCSPFALKYKDVSTAIKYAIEDSLITHDDPIVRGCVSKYITVLNSLIFEKSKTKERKKQIISFCNAEGSTFSGGKMQKIDTALNAAFACFSRTDSFTAAVQMAVRLGGDTDTVASITGALAGSWYDLNTIPSCYLDPLEKIDLIKSLQKKLLNL